MAETLIYLGTAGITVLWSVWIYLWWLDKARLPDESAARMVLIVAPSSYFLLAALSGWAAESSFRLDLAGLVALDALTVLSAVFLAIFAGALRAGRRGAYLTVLVVYNAVAIAIVAASYLVHGRPVVLRRLASEANLLGRINLLGGIRQPDFAELLSKLFLAVVSYLPVSVIRLLGSVRQRRRMARELQILRSRVEEVERRLAERERAP